MRVKLMPLLSGNVEMDTVAIDGLDLILNETLTSRIGTTSPR